VLHDTPVKHVITSAIGDLLGFRGVLFGQHRTVEGSGGFIALAVLFKALCLLGEASGFRPCGFSLFGGSPALSLGPEPGGPDRSRTTRRRVQPLMVAVEVHPAAGQEHAVTAAHPAVGLMLATVADTDTGLIAPGRLPGAGRLGRPGAAGTPVPRGCPVCACRRSGKGAAWSSRWHLFGIAGSHLLGQQALGGSDDVR